MKNLVLKSIRFYQKYLSFDTGLPKKLFFLPKVCRFQPTCSEYTYDAVNYYGIIKGLFLGFKRIARCHPWSKGGYDPVLPKRK
jgi:uncharacterized protein